MVERAETFHQALSCHEHERAVNQLPPFLGCYLPGGPGPGANPAGAAGMNGLQRPEPLRRDLLYLARTRHACAPIKHAQPWALLLRPRWHGAGMRWLPERARTATSLGSHLGPPTSRKEQPLQASRLDASGHGRQLRGAPGPVRTRLQAGRIPRGVPAKAESCRQSWTPSKERLQRLNSACKGGRRQRSACKG